MGIHFEVVQDGKRFSARPDGGAAFPVGARVRYAAGGVERFGLTNVGGHFGSDLAGNYAYDAADYAASHPFWAQFIEPTALCEGRSFIALNTYDRAHFTFGFAQFAAHVPDGDFVRWLRDMLRRPEAAHYFPELTLDGGRIARLVGGIPVPLETAASTQPLQLALNPTLDEVEEAEVVAAARLIHWTTTHPSTRRLQVDHMVSTARRLVREADGRLGLDGRGADLCCVVMDIRHQGRGRYDAMQSALAAGDPYEALLKVGEGTQHGRVSNLRAALATRRAGLAARRWSRAAGDFV